MQAKPLGQAIYEICYLSMALVMLGSPIPLVIVNIFYLSSPSELKIFLFKIGDNVLTNHQRQITINILR